MKKIVKKDYVLGCIATIKLSLCHSLVRSELFLSIEQVSLLNWKDSLLEEFI
jgi:hypothetical protein